MWEKSGAEVSIDLGQPKTLFAVSADGIENEVGFGLSSLGNSNACGSIFRLIIVVCAHTASM